MSLRAARYSARPDSSTSGLLRLRLPALNLLPFGFAPLHLFLRDGEHLADGVVEPLGVRVAGYAGSRLGFHLPHSLTRTGDYELRRIARVLLSLPLAGSSSKTGFEQLRLDPGIRILLLPITRLPAQRECRSKRKGWLPAVFRLRDTRTTPDVVHRLTMCVFAHSPQSQKYLVGKHLIANAPSSGRN